MADNSGMTETPDGLGGYADTNQPKQSDATKSIPFVGCWATYCCSEDLHEVVDKADVQEHLEFDRDMEDDDLHGYTYWPTKQAALEQLSHMEGIGLAELSLKVDKNTANPQEEHP